MVRNDWAKGRHENSQPINKLAGFIVRRIHKEKACLSGTKASRQAALRMVTVKWCTKVTNDVPHSGFFSYTMLCAFKKFALNHLWGEKQHAQVVLYS